MPLKGLYQLTQFHFHRPSEEQVNGKPYDMVLHLMHQTSDGKVAGVAVLKRGKANPAVPVSPAQISAFAKLYPDDVRLPQPLNGRIVKESQ